MLYQNEKKNLIIVCDKNTIKHANNLGQLISANDDDGEKTIGTKDGTVDAVIWNEKEYQDNKPQISGNQYVLFIGNSKLMDNEIGYIENKYDEYGMQYGWLGKRAFMRVDGKKLKKDEYKSFLEFCKKYNKEFEEIKRGTALNATCAVSTIIMGLMGSILAIPMGIIWYSFKNGKMKKINEQRYICLTVMFYLDSLQKFLEE